MKKIAVADAPKKTAPFPRAMRLNLKVKSHILIFKAMPDCQFFRICGPLRF